MAGRGGGEGSDLVSREWEMSEGWAVGEGRGLRSTMPRETLKVSL